MIRGNLFSGANQIDPDYFSGSYIVHQALNAACKNMQDMYLSGKDNSEAFHLLLRHDQKMPFWVLPQIAKGNDLPLKDDIRKILKHLRILKKPC